MKDKVTFSLSRKGLQGPVPAYMARRLDIYAALTGVLITGINSAPFPIPAAVASTLSWFLGLFVAGCLAIKPFYSIETTQKNVPIDQVDTMESKPEDK